MYIYIYLVYVLEGPLCFSTNGRCEDIKTVLRAPGEVRMQIRLSCNMDLRDVFSLKKNFIKKKFFLISKYI
jgi:hypothetical protein